MQIIFFWRVYHGVFKDAARGIFFFLFLVVGGVEIENFSHEKKMLEMI